MEYRIKKGISPIVASVLLIAFSTAIAAVVGTWAMNYSQDEITQLEVCKNVNVVYSDFQYDSTTQSGSVNLQNIGAPIDGYRIYAFMQGNQKIWIKDIDASIPKGDLRLVDFELETEDVKGVLIEIKDCPGTRLIIPFV